MEIEVLEHPINSVYNGIYRAVNYLYHDDTRYIHFKHINEQIYLYFYQTGGENDGIWVLSENEGEYESGGNLFIMYNCWTYMCLFYTGIV